MLNINKILVYLLLFFSTTNFVFSQSESISNSINAKVYSNWNNRKINLLTFGKANLYFSSKNYYNPNSGSGSITKYYFNKGNGELQKLKIKNLKISLQDDPKSMKYLKKISTFYWVAGSVGASGLLLTFANLGPVFRNFGNVNPNIPDEKMNPLMYVGIAAALTANFSLIFGPKPNKVISIYNNK